ncbi:hypothetical protein BCR44DRAFT_1273812 [Catenaria anguillulae PL171]|uniref:Uncharacterized protein n=1 Tax=Catenaria anguillulae PL171 TaxID=765915 RepID=A0A1Y2H9Y5_9FUNG|nr:hypothetical protein BCR44DRAFT_1273812 [Catenaria anguillulae PL171]
MLTNAHADPPQYAVIISAIFQPARVLQHAYPYRRRVDLPAAAPSTRNRTNITTQPPTSHDLRRASQTTSRTTRALFLVPCPLAFHVHGLPSPATASLCPSKSAEPLVVCARSGWRLATRAALPQGLYCDKQSPLPVPWMRAQRPVHQPAPRGDRHAARFSADGVCAEVADSMIEQGVTCMGMTRVRRFCLIWAAADGQWPRVQVSWVGGQAHARGNQRSESLLRAEATALVYSPVHGYCQGMWDVSVRPGDVSETLLSTRPR